MSGQGVDPVGAAGTMFSVAIVIWRMLMRAILLVLVGIWAGCLWWLNRMTVMRARNPDAGRRWPWIVLGTAGLVAAVSPFVAPAVAAQVGLIPAVGVLAVPLAVVMLRRRPRRPAAPPAPSYAQASAVHGDWAHTPRAKALERLVIELVIHLGDQGLAARDLAAAAARCSLYSRSLLLLGIGSQLSEMAELEQDGLAGRDRGLSDIGLASIPWLLELEGLVRREVGGLVAAAPAGLDPAG